MSTFRERGQHMSCAELVAAGDVSAGQLALAALASLGAWTVLDQSGPSAVLTPFEFNILIARREQSSAEVHARIRAGRNAAVTDPTTDFAAGALQYG